MSWMWLAMFCTMAVVARSQEMQEHRRNDEFTESKRKPQKSEIVVEKFVETLMTSEKYLKMIETVQKKLHHLDASFHNRSNVIMKYMVEMLKVMKSSTPEGSDKMLKIIKNDIDKIYRAVNEKDTPVMNNQGTASNKSKIYLICSLITVIVIVFSFIFH